MSDAVPGNPAVEALLRREQLDTVAGAFSHAGGEVLSKPGLGLRQRIRLRLTDEAGREVTWYLKRYEAAAWPVRLWRRLCGRGGTTPARAELGNIQRLQASGVATMQALAVGEDADWLGARRSYLIVSAVPGEALERCVEDRLRSWDAETVRRFNAALVELACKLHLAGLVHRDFYASHIFLDEATAGPTVYLIDLARMFAPRWRRFRWQVKDLAELRYSMPPAGVQPHWEAFLAEYVAAVKDSRPAARWAAAIDAKVAFMCRRRRRRQRRAVRADE